VPLGVFHATPDYLSFIVFIKRSISPFLPTGRGHTKVNANNKIIPSHHQVTGTKPGTNDLWMIFRMIIPLPTAKPGFDTFSRSTLPQIVFDRAIHESLRMEKKI